MKRIILTFAITALVTLGAYSQESAAKKPTSFAWNRQALKEIGCSEDQIERVLDVRKKSMEEIKVMLANTALSEEEKKAELKKAYTRRYQEYKTILTPEQNEQVNEISKKLKKEAAQK